MTLRSSASISSAHARTSASGCARIRSSSASNAWPVPKMPTFDCVAAGSMPRSVSSALARIAARCTPSESAGALRISRARSAPASPGSAARRSRTPRPSSARSARAARRADLRRDVIAPAAVQRVGVRHVARRLLEIRHQPSPLEHLGQDVRDVLAGDVRAAELRDRVVAVLVEDPRVQLFGARDRRRRADRAATRPPRRPCGTRRGTAGAATSPSASSARRARP